MELLYRRHLPPGLGDLDAVPDENGPAVHPKDAGVGAEDQAAQFLVEELDHVEVVKDDGGLRQMGGNRLDVGYGHVDGDRLDPAP